MMTNTKLFVLRHKKKKLNGRKKNYGEKRHLVKIWKSTYILTMMLVYNISIWFFV